MRSVEIRLLTRNLSRELIAMREWLDRAGFEPSQFTYNANRNGSEVLVHVTFTMEREAATFAESFCGVLVTPAG
ncbi:MAG: hypothetical protein JWL84_1060 [Rhodospirillales bacterium]|jgi:hypothetical protein|nr:hypothetical protein [Rhodospirillales bacterium]